MAVQYRITGIKSHFDPSGKERFIARPCNRQKVDLDKLAELITKRSTAGPGDVVAVLYNLVQLIPELLMENQTIHLKPLGVFSLSFSCKPADHQEDINAKDIGNFRIQFLPDPKIKNRIRNTKVKKAPDPSKKQGTK